MDSLCNTRMPDHGRKYMDNKYCIVTAPCAFLYETADGTAIADEMLSGWAAAISAETPARLNVMTHYGYTGWIDRNMVKYISREEVKAREDERNTNVLTGMFTDLMAEPTVHGKILGTYGRGCFVKMKGRADECYFSVEAADGSVGYMPSIAMDTRIDSDRFLTEPDNGGIFAELAKERVEEIGKSKLRSAIAVNVLKYIGTQYRWGGKNADGIDCSGLAFMSYMLAGVLIYRDADIRDGYPIHEIGKERLGCGDLLFFKGHVAVYLGSDHYIHSTGFRESCGCVINSLNPKDGDYRRDLAEGILHIGSIF